MASSTQKKKSFKQIVAEYFSSPLRPISNILLFAGAIVIIVGWALASYATLIAGFAVYAVASVCAIVRCVLVMKSTKKHQASHKEAFVNIIIMGVILGLCLFGLIWAIVA